MEQKTINFDNFELLKLLNKYDDEESKKEEEISEPKSRPTHKAILDYWEKRQEELGINFSLKEPKCWCCNNDFQKIYTDKNDDKLTYYKRWKKLPLQRCHIIPTSLGGSNNVSNIILMCSECHDLAPNTIYKEIFIKWLSKQDYMERFRNRLISEMEVFDINTPAHQMISLAYLQNENFLKWVKDKFSSHKNQMHHSYVGSKVTISSIIGLIKYSFDNEIEFLDYD